jgi:hypothetical protein
MKITNKPGKPIWEILKKHRGYSTELAERTGKKANYVSRVVKYEQVDSIVWPEVVKYAFEIFPEETSVRMEYLKQQKIKELDKIFDA